MAWGKESDGEVTSFLEIVPLHSTVALLTLLKLCEAPIPN